MHYAICDFVLDIAQNAVEAGSRLVILDFEETAEAVTITVVDDGKGMTDEERERALDPFYTDGVKHVKRKVGLGLPFLVQAVEQTNGTWSIESKKGQGTTVRFRFPLDSVDCPPIGAIPALFLSLLCLPGDFEMKIRRTKLGHRDDPSVRYELSRSELSEVVGGLELGSSLVLLRDYLASQEEEE